MNTFWEFLAVQYPASSISSKGYWRVTSKPSKAESDCHITALSQYGFLAVEGPDSSKFLQGQTTCDWRKIDIENASLGSYCNIKGRMVISFIAGMRDGESALLRLRSDTADTGCATLAKYIVFSKAKIRNATNEYIGLGISGKCAREQLQQYFGFAPTAMMRQATDGETTLVQLDSDGERFECWAPAASANAIWTALSENACAIDSCEWEALNIAAGIGEICADTQDMFIPQMLNHQLIGGVSFNKGCYTGQEIVARMQYRAKLKRRLYRGILNTSTNAADYKPGTDLFSDDGTQSIGNLVSAVTRGTGVELLAVLTDEAVATNQVHFAGEAATLEILDLPYSVPTAD
ncbi:folate-binding protein [Zhongshania sp.]|uniref:CAF17-like 4Fe-4S cluster assembly/insertion protein YgfZ n=1 Tax=Zhongshania sp. TaxID=1971902 RepID=UPI001B637860|nr:folate-binding protein [Zhongshania sp.]MBQ0796652.1 folate-binding protein YgfZ [Zhongshania sp.]